MGVFMTFIKFFFCMTYESVFFFFFFRKWGHRSIANYHEIVKVTQPTSNSRLLLAHVNSFSMVLFEMELSSSLSLDMAL